MYLLEEGLATNQYEVDTSTREIAKKTGMSRATAGRAMDDLLEARVVLFLRGENQNLRIDTPLPSGMGSVKGSSRYNRKVLPYAVKGE